MTPSALSTVIYGLPPDMDGLPSEPSPWRVTAFQPIRQAQNEGSMDFERCAALHNELMETGWFQSGKLFPPDADADAEPDVQSNPRMLPRQSWFQYHGDTAEDVREYLSPSLTAFLDQAWTNEGHSLFYYVWGLASPEYLWLNWENDQFIPVEEAALNPYRYLTLYGANGISSHPDGLIFDQQENKAIMQMSILDAPITQNGRQQWYPLEVVLSAWLDMVDVGKVQAVEPQVEVLNDKFDPWIILGYSENLLKDTLEAWNALLSAVESRRGPTTSVEEADEPLLPAAALDAAVIPSGFARAFLTQARRPSFQLIAPGLSLPTASSFTRQPFSSVEPDPPSADPDDPTIQFPILLFASSDTFRSPPGSDTLTGSDLPFQWPWCQVSAYAAGLYLTDSDRESLSFDDGVRLVTPFGLGTHGYARTADGARFGENKEDRDPLGRPGLSFHSLFQPGYSPFVESHEVRLAQVLRAWTRLVEHGVWEVGPDGILGAMDKWHEADTAARWEDYVIPISW